MLRFIAIFGLTAQDKFGEKQIGRKNFALNTTRMSIMEYNGTAMIAMSGKNCVALASDLRFGIQQLTLATDFKKTFRIHDKCYIGLSGLATDTQTIRAKLDFRIRMYTLREERIIKPAVVAAMLSSMLYERRFGPYFVEPLIVGLQDDAKTGEKNVPYLCGTDLIGAPVYTSDFLVGGTTSEELYGVCEAMYKKDMDADQLFETISQCLLAGQDRDCLAGWGALVTIITPDGVTTRELKTRKD